MSETLSLFSAIVLGRAHGKADLELHSAEAEAAGIDLIEHITHAFGLNEEVVMERAARWAGLAYAATLPQHSGDGAVLPELDRLAEARALRLRVDDGGMVFAAPRFGEFVTLARYVVDHPEFRVRFCVVPARRLRRALTEASAERLSAAAADRLSDLWPGGSARDAMSLKARLVFALGVLCVLGLAAAAPFVWRPVLLPLVGALLAAPALLRLAAAVLPPARRSPPPELADGDLPVYSVIVPLRDEAGMVPQLAQALRALHYPAAKLDIAFVVEATSPETVAAAEAELHDPRFRIVVVPDTQPRTKPKAMNYALPTVRGTFVAVYDAEDVPDPDQLRLAARSFAQSPELDCLQAELVIENAGENRLTALFAGEYAGQFGLMLPLLARLGFPMPLGGTSNHFRVAALRQAGGWDAFNVTEDADLGIRFARLHHGIATIPSRTLEEAPVTMAAWLRQRTRWMKGWMQTFIVHNRHPGKFRAEVGWRSFLGFQLYVGSQIVAGPLHAVFLASLLANLLLNRPLAIDGWDWASLAFFALGYGGAAAIVVAGLARLGRWDLVPAQVWLPGYWLLHAVAALCALWELLTRPYFWAKTQHGRSGLAPPQAPAEIVQPVQAE